MIAIFLLFVALSSYVSDNHDSSTNIESNQSTINRLEEILSVKQEKTMHNYSLVYSESTREDNINLSRRRIRELSSKLFVLTDNSNKNNSIN